MNNTIKILHLTVSGGIVGGGDTIISNLLSEKRDNLNESLATLRRSVFMQDLAHKLAIRHYQPKRAISLYTSGKLQAVEVVIRSSIFLLSLAKLIRREKIQLIHAHGFAPLLAALFLKKISGAKIIYTHHFYRTKPGRLAALLMRMLYDRTEANTGVSMTVCDSMNEAFPSMKHKFICVYNCVGREFFEPQVPSVMYNNVKKDGRRIFIQAARFHEFKNQIYVAKAVMNLDPELRKRIYVIFLGEGPEKQKVEKYVEESGLSENFCFEGAVEPSYVPSLMAAADFGLFPSELEGFGLGAVECMALGLPVLAQNNKLMREVVGAGGVLTDIMELDKGIEKLLSGSEDLKRAARQQAENFRPAKVREDYSRLYESVSK